MYVQLDVNICLAESDFRNEAPEGFFLTNVPYEGYTKKTFDTEYDLLDIIGKGALSEVKKCRYNHIFCLDTNLYQTPGTLLT